MNESIKLNRFRRLEKYLETHDFDNLLYRIILEHNDEWDERCCENGDDPYPNNKLNFVFDYILHYGKAVKVKKFKNKNPNQIFEFNNFYFQIVIDEKIVWNIFNKEDMRKILSI